MRALSVHPWNEVTFADIVVDSAFGPRFSGNAYSDNGNISTLRTTDIYEDGRISYETMPRAQLDEAKFEKHFLKPGDLVITRSGRIGTTAIFEGYPEPVLPGAFLIRFRLRHNADPKFFCYWFNSQNGQKRLLSVARGAAQQNINITEVQKLKVVFPPLSVQRHINSILSVYDDLIENNRRRMALIEESARLLYQEWFVRLRFPGHEHTRIIGRVPEGWERKTIAVLTTFLSRGIAPHYDDEGEGLVINQKCIRNGRLDSSLARRQSREFKPNRQVQPGDVLINSTGEGTLGRVAQVTAAIPNCTVDTHVTIVRPKSEIGMHYFGMAVLEWEPRFSTMGRGATNQTELSRGQIGEAEIMVPSHSLIQQFEEFATPLFRQIATLVDQNQKLRTARDLLLPKLMSGEIAV